MTKFRGPDDPGYKCVSAVLRKWTREIKEFPSLVPKSTATEEVKDTANGKQASIPKDRIYQGSSSISGVNNTRGGSVIQGNNILGSINFGR